jgi:hypothetical protein
MPSPLAPGDHGAHDFAVSSATHSLSGSLANCFTDDGVFFFFYSWAALDRAAIDLLFDFSIQSRGHANQSVTHKTFIGTET